MTHNLNLSNKTSTNKLEDVFSEGVQKPTTANACIRCNNLCASDTEMFCPVCLEKFKEEAIKHHQSVTHFRFRCEAMTEVMDQRTDRDSEDKTLSVLEDLYDVFLVLPDPEDLIESNSGLYNWIKSRDDATKIEISQRLPEVEKKIDDLNHFIMMAEPFILRVAGDTYYRDDDALSEHRYTYTMYLLEKYLSNFGWVQGSEIFD